MAPTTPMSPDEQLQYALLSRNPEVIAQAKNLVNTGSALTPEQKQAAIQYDLSSPAKELQAQGQLLKTGVSPSGYHTDQYGNAVKNPSLMDKISNTVGVWGPLLVGGLAGGFGLAGALGGGGSAAGAIPNIATTTGLPSTAGIGTSVGALSLPGAAASAVPAIATTTGLTAPVGVDVTAAGTSLPSSGGIGSVLSKLVNPKSLAQNAIKNVVGKGQQQQSQDQSQQPTTPMPQTSPQQQPSFPIPPPMTTMQPYQGNYASLAGYGVAPNSNNIQSGPAVGQLSLPNIISSLMNQNYG